MVGTKKRWMTALLVLVLAVCLSALCWFVLPAKTINAADGSGAETTTEQPAAGESQSAEALQQAIDAAADGATVQMTSNITGNISIAEGKNIVLDLNGFTLTGEGNHTIVNNGTLTVIDSSAAKRGAVDNVTHGRGALVNNGTAILDGGTFKRSAEAGVSATDNGGNSWYVIDNHGTLTINDGVAVYHGTSAETAAQWKYSSLIRNIGTGADATATLTVNGGEFNTGLIALKNDDFGMLDVNGGQISSGNQAVQNWYKATVDGGTFDGMVITWFYSNNTGAADMTISDGTFSGQVKSVDFEAGSDGVYPLVSDGTTISGGTFDVLPLKVEYLAADVALDVVDGAYSVVQGQAAANAVIDGSTYPFVDENDIIEQGTFAAQIGSTFFETLADAVWSTDTGDVEATVITIIGEGDVISGPGVQINGQNVIIDLNGKTYNVINPTVGSPGTETNAFQMLKGSTVVFRNGALTSGVAKILLQNYCDLTLENVTIDATGSSSIQYIASNNNGSFTAVGNTQLIAGEGQVAFDVYYGMSANYDDGVTVTFGEDFTGKVVGKVEYSAASRVTDGTWQDKAVVTIENGEFDIAINLVDNESATDANINISGGNFTQAFDGAYLASDAVLYPTADGAFAVADQATAEQETIGVAQIGQVIYETLADALAAAQDGDEIDLLTNISAPGAINITNDITLDFNGHAIDSDRTIAIVIDGANANIISTGARGTLNTPANGISVINGSNVEISDIDIYTEIYILKKDDGSQQVYDGRAIQIVGSTAVIDNVVTSLTADNADYTVAHWYIGDSDVTITNSCVMLVYTRSAASAENGSLQGYAVYSDNSDVTIENSSISSTGDETAYGVIFFGNMAIADAAAANGEGFKTLSLTDTAVIADAFAVSGNGTPNDCSGTDIVITGDCKIKSNYAQAIYHPQYGVLTINLTEDSALAYIRGVSGIEMRAGELVVIGGYIEATGDELDSMPNGNGSTTSGAAIAIVQHTTKQPINVRLDGGVFNGVFAVYEENQQNNEQAAVEKISLAINGGVFNGRIGSENLVDFVNGGTFSEIPNYNYFADGYIWTDNGDGTYDVEQSEETFVAVIDGIGYTSLLAAMEAAPEGATITLIDEVVVDTEVTLDLSGYVIVIDETFPSDTYDVAIRVIEGGALTIAGDGVIDAQRAGDNVVPVAAMRANSSIIMNGGTIIVDTPSESCLFAMGGSITINGGTLENLCKDEYSYGGGRTQVVNISNGTPGKLVINGGTFIGRNPALGDDNLGGRFIAEDAKLAQSTDENGNVVYKALGQDETVAGVDAVYYVENGLAVAEVYTAAALADALAATTGADKNPAYDVIRLGDDISGNIVVDKGRTLTIDLNGYTLTGEGDHTIVNNGTLTITDGVGGGKVVVTADSEAALLNYGDATLLGGEFTRETAGTGGWYVIKNYGSLVIGEENKECGVVVDSNGGDESSLLVSGYYDAGDKAANEGLITSANPLKVVINGGTFNGGLNTIKNDSESVMTINGGTFTNGKNYTVQNCNEMTVNGGTFVQTASKDVNGLKAVYALYSDDNTQLTITAGDFTAVTYAVYLKSNVNADIRGGMFEGETALYAGKKVTLTISGGAFTGTENYGISIDANAVVDISGEETVISGSEYGLRVSSAFGNINISDATISGETAVYMNRPTSYAITSGVFNGAINVTNNTAGISGGKFAVMPNEAYFIEGLTGALVDGYYVTVKATSPVEELRPAIFEAQAAVRSYAAALGINWADIASARAADAQAVLAAYDAIESAASVDLVLVAQLNAMDALDEYAAALAAALDAYKAEKIAALETLAGDGYVPAYAIAAINGAASVAEVDACYNAAVAEINAADDSEITPPTPSDNGDGISLTGVYVMLGVILVVAVAALMILLLKKQKQAEAAEAKAAAPLDRELAEVKQAVEADETAAAVSAAAEDDDKEQIVIEANVRTFDEAYDELDDEQKKLFNDVKDYALTKEGAALTELSSGVCVKKGSKQIVKLTVRRGNPVALFVIENEMIKDFRRNSDAPVKLKVKATELVLRSGGDLEAAKAMVDVAVDQIEKDILAAKERRREARRLRRQRKREQKRQ